MKDTLRVAPPGLGFKSGRKFQNRLFRGLLAVSFLLAACSAAGDASPTATSPAPAPASSQGATATPPAGAQPTTQAGHTAPKTAAPKTAAPSASTPTLPAGTFVNPILDRDFPDPDVLSLDGRYYAYSTNSLDTNIPVAVSDDLVNWQDQGDALPELPAWAIQEFGWAWAPDVITGTGDAPFLMYFTARFAYGRGGTQCIGVATGEQPQGPFTPYGEDPLICQIEQGGSIDPASYIDGAEDGGAEDGEDGTRYLLWKNDGNSGGGQSWIWIQQLSPDGLALEGEPVKLITADQVWEGILVEGPTLWKQDGRYYLFYSANSFNTPKYAVGYAIADDLLGPYQKADDPLLATKLPAGIVGPGGQDVVLDDEGQTWILFHSWTPGAYRNLNLARLKWENGTPEVTGLSREPQPAPEDEDQ